MSMYVCVYLHTLVYELLDACMHARTHTHTHTYMLQAQTYTQTRTHTHTHKDAIPFMCTCPSYAIVSYVL